MCSHISSRARNETLQVRFYLTSGDAAFFFFLCNAPAAVRRQRVLYSYTTFNVAAQEGLAQDASSRQHNGKK